MLRLFALFRQAWKVSIGNNSETTHSRQGNGFSSGIFLSSDRGRTEVTKLAGPGLLATLRDRPAAIGVGGGRVASVARVAGLPLGIDVLQFVQGVRHSAAASISISGVVC